MPQILTVWFQGKRLWNRCAGMAWEGSAFRSGGGGNRGRQPQAPGPSSLEDQASNAVTVLANTMNSVLLCCPIPGAIPPLLCCLPLASAQASASGAHWLEEVSFCFSPCRPRGVGISPLMPIPGHSYIHFHLDKGPQDIQTLLLDPCESVI